MSKNPNIHEERDSFGSRPNKSIKKEEWVEESFGKESGSTSPKKSLKKPPAKGKRKK